MDRTNILPLFSRRSCRPTNSAMRLLLAVSFALLHCVHGANDDLFNYRETDGNDYGPEDWDQVTCDDLEQCTGWPDDWQLGVGWELKNNDCEWCPEGSDRCGVHHQSPIDLERNRALNGTATWKECIDKHWMKYEDGSCKWYELVNRKAFTVERHALKITQPLEYNNGGQEGIRLDCPSEDERRFGRIDFSKGFHDWWFLSHIDIKVPSEHSQEGKTYSAEIQMAHFYSLSQEDCACDNQMATVAIFLQAYDDSPDYPFLNRLICEWRKAEDRTREECGLPSVGPYPGCFNFARGHTSFPSEGPQYPSSAPSFPTFAPTTGVPTDPTISPVAIPGAPTPMPTEQAPRTGAPTTPQPSDSPSMAPTSKPPPTPFPTVPTTPDPAALITFAPITSPALAPVTPTNAVPTSAPIVQTPVVTNVTKAPITSAPISQAPVVPNVTNAPVTSPPTVAPVSTEAPLTSLPVSSSLSEAPAPKTPTADPKSNPVFTDEPVTTQPTIKATPAPIPDSTKLPTAKPTLRPTDTVRKLRKSVHDVLKDNNGRPQDRKKQIIVDEINFRPADNTDEERAEWIEAYSAHRRGEATEDQRKLLEQDQLSFHNYQFLIDVRTEYYFRYSGTSTVPPCYAKYDGTRAHTNHWRVLKDPIRVSPRQIAELERLLRERIAPADDNRKACENDTAGKVDADGHISVARPRMQFAEQHFMTFCECDDWPSKWPEDREWCAINEGDKETRLYVHPYNYFSDGFEV